MTDANWQRIHQLFDAALALPEPERKAYLEGECANTPELLLEVNAMLAADAGTGSLNDVIDDLTEDYRHTHEGRFAGRQVGPFVVKELLGRGGMGLVYRAERTSGGFEQQVAIKFLLEPDPGLAKRLETERQALSLLSHPNIAKIYDAGVLDCGAPYLVMEYVKGEPLSQYLKSTQPGQAEILNLFRTICDAVAHSHRHLIIHRDIKPSNILVSPEGLPTLLDFGIAKNLVFSDDLQVTQTHERAWSPNYASPEQVRGEALSTVTDIYALGLILYRLLTGTDAQQTSGLSLDQAIEVICEQQPPDPTQAGSIPPDVARIIFKATHKDPEQRYASARELADDVQRYQSGAPVLAAGDSIGYRLGKLIARHRLGTAILAVGLLLLGVAVFQVVVERNLALTAQVATERQLQRANRVSDFLVEIFKAANVHENRGRPVTAQALLDQALEDIETAVVDPLLKVQLLRTIGAAYTNSALEEKGLEAFALALDTLRDIDSPDRLFYAELLAWQASANLSSQKHELALPLYEQALEIQTELLPLNDPLIAKTLNGLGAALVELSRLDEARQYQQQAYAILKTQDPPNRLSIAASHHNLAGLERYASNNEAALEEINRSLAIKREVYGEQQAGYADGLRLRSLIYRQRSDWDAVLADLNQVLAIYQDKLDPDTERMRAIIGEIANHHHDMGRFDQAQHYYLQQLDHPTVSAGSGSRAIVLNNLGSLYEDTERYALALPLFEESLSIRRTLFGEDSGSASTAYNNLGRLLRRLADFERSRPLLERALKIRADLFGLEHPKYVGSLLEIGWLDLLDGNQEQCKQGIDQALAIMDRNGRQKSGNRARAYELEASYWTDQGDINKALKMLHQAHQQRLDRLGEDHPFSVRLAAKIASLEAT